MLITLNKNIISNDQFKLKCSVGKGGIKKKIKEGDLYRLISSGFLHVNTTHLLFNMVTFYFFVKILQYS